MNSKKALRCRENITEKHRQRTSPKISQIKTYPAGHEQYTPQTGESCSKHATTVYDALLCTPWTDTLYTGQRRCLKYSTSLCSPRFTFCLAFLKRLSETKLFTHATVRASGRVAVDGISLQPERPL